MWLNFRFKNANMFRRIAFLYNRKRQRYLYKSDDKEPVLLFSSLIIGMLQKGWGVKGVWLSGTRKKLLKCLNMWVMMMNCFHIMVDRRKAFSLIPSRDHSQRFSPSQISDKPQAGIEPGQNLSSAFVEWSCAVVVTTTPRGQGNMIEVFPHNGKKTQPYI